MKIETKIGEHIINYKWDNPIYQFQGNELYLKYDEDISKTPLHIANFLFVVLMQDALTLTGKPVILGELTDKENRELNSIMQMSYHSHGCAGRKRRYNVSEKPIITSIKIVEPNHPGDSGPILTTNGLGKDGLNLALLTLDLGLTPRCFTLYNQYAKRMGLWKERCVTANKFYKKHGISHSLIETNFFKNRRKRVGFYPYITALPLAFHYESNVILNGSQLHANKRSIEDRSIYCPGESIFSLNHITKATDIKFSNSLTPLSNFGAQDLLSKRWPENLKYQRSCMYGDPWCGKCSKCNRKSLYIETRGIDPMSISLPKFKEKYLKLDKNYGPVQDSVRQVLKKRRGEPYNSWVDGANDKALEIIWAGSEIKKILQEHFPIYDEDPGSDGEGYTIEPSKWKDELK